jgi:ubiquinone/menaquinone biosynthesis C-methylase UbiE
MTSDERAARATSFGAVAETYERARPSYPDEAVTWLVGPRPRRVVDVGAGTGKLTARLVAAGHDVVAVEPSEPMRGQLQAAVPGVPTLAGRAEALPLDDASVDAVTVAQAWHWVDESRAVPEAARVLRPGGVLGLIWNVREESQAWQRRFGELISDTEATYADPLQLCPGTRASPLFGPLAEEEFAFEQQLDRAGLVDLAASRSGVATRAPADRAAVLRSVRDLFDEHVDATGRLTLAYRTVAYRAVRTA